MGFRIIIGIVALITLARAADRAEVLPPPPYPPAAWMKGDWGDLKLNVSFGADGYVTNCQITNSAISPELGQATANFITKHWRSPKHAGTVVAVPIAFRPPNAYLPHPGYPTRARIEHIQGSFVVYVTFDAKGRVAKCGVAPSTASELLTMPTCAFIYERWAAPIFAGKTIPVPIYFVLPND